MTRDCCRLSVSSPAKQVTTFSTPQAGLAECGRPAATIQVNITKPIF